MTGSLDWEVCDGEELWTITVSKWLKRWQFGDFRDILAPVGSWCWSSGSEPMVVFNVVIGLISRWGYAKNQHCWAVCG